MKTKFDKKFYRKKILEFQKRIREVEKKENRHPEELRILRKQEQYLKDCLAKLQDTQKSSKEGK